MLELNIILSTFRLSPSLPLLSRNFGDSGKNIKETDTIRLGMADTATKILQMYQL